MHLTFTPDVIATARRRLAAFKRDVRGSITTIFAMGAIPIVAAAGVAVDYNRVVEAQSTLQALADRAALTGVGFAGTSDEQIQAAEDYLTGADEFLTQVTYTTQVTKPSSTDIKVVIDATVEGTLLPVVVHVQSGQGGDNGGNGLADADISVDATARVTEGGSQPMCVVTLNPSAANALYIRGSGAFTATACGMFSNSTSATAAANFQGAITASADFFFSVGTWQITGSAATYNHTPESGKSAISNPLSGTNVTCPSSATASSVSPGGNSVSPTSLGGNYTDITMQNNKYANFTAGTHYIFGEIDLKNGGVLTGSGVTLVLCGADAHINMNGGSLQIQAPTSGSYAGYAIIGSSTATHESTLQGGPDTWIRGAYYTPNAKLTISGNATFNSNSKYFPIIVDQLETGGTGAINIENDATFYGFPGLDNMTTTSTRDVYLVN
jgi:Flp pilus assembly protein TadG